MLTQTLLEPLVKTPSRPISSLGQDRLWISQTLAGDPQAYAKLMSKYKDQLLFLTRRVLKNHCEGEDILQDAFLKAYMHLSDFRYESKFSTWMYAIVWNGLRNHLRRTRIIRWSSLDTPRQDEDDFSAPEIAHKEPSIDATLERKLDIEAIQEMIPSMPQTYQAIFIMYYFQNLSLQQIAGRVKRPKGTVKVYLHRSRKMLYKAFMCLSPEFAE